MEIRDRDEKARTGAGRPTKYPWDKWLVDDKTVTIVRGEDFECSRDTLRPQIHHQARKRLGTVSTRFLLKGDQELIEIDFTAGVTEGDFEFEKTG